MSGSADGSDDAADGVSKTRGIGFADVVGVMERPAGLEVGLYYVMDGAILFGYDDDVDGLKASD